MTNPPEETSRRTTIIDRSAKPASSALRQIARGSAWMMAARWSMRVIGLISTIVLARLLEPIDFGIVAMATVAIAFLRIFADAGQDLAVIRHPNPTADHFDTAWTMSVFAGAVVALVLVAIAPVAGWYFHEPQVVPVIRVLALAPLIEGFFNIGAIAGFRRELAFDKEFRFMVVRKLSSFVVTLPLALALHSYWALAIGIVCGRVATLIVSFRMHPYRPRLRLSKLREIWSYSAWMQFSEVGSYFGSLSDQVIVGGIAGTVAMGAYNVAEDLATAPTEELVSPAARAVFPVYATLLQDPVRLAQSYLTVLSVTAIIALSTGVGVALVADDFVAVVLGPKWAFAALLVPWLAVGTAMFGVARSVTAVLSVTGNARLNAIRTWAFVALLVPAAIGAGLAWGAEGVAAARMIVTILFIPLMFYTLTQVISVTYPEIFACLWRPILASLAMAAVVSVAVTNAISSVPLRLFCNVGLGSTVFATTLLGLWVLAGRPDGAERLLIIQVGKAVRRLASDAAQGAQLIWQRTGVGRMAEDAPFVIAGMIPLHPVVASEE